MPSIILSGGLGRSMDWCKVSWICFCSQVIFFGVARHSLEGTTWGSVPVCCWCCWEDFPGVPSDVFIWGGRGSFLIWWLDVIDLVNVFRGDCTSIILCVPLLVVIVTPIASGLTHCIKVLGVLDKVDLLHGEDVWSDGFIRGTVLVNRSVPIHILEKYPRLVCMYGNRRHECGFRCDAMMASARMVCGPHSFECGILVREWHLTQVAFLG